MTKKLFGTDGIRGIANEFPIDIETISTISKAIINYLNNNNNNNNYDNERKNKIKIAIAKDTRFSRKIIENQLTSSINSLNCDVIKLGIIPTPALAFLTKKLNCDIGIMISASHNPYQDNGIKLFDSNGLKLSDIEEEKIEIEILKELNKEKLEIEKKINYIKNDNKKQIFKKKITKIGKTFYYKFSKKDYIQFAKNTINNLSLDKLKIAIDCANGASSFVAPLIFKSLNSNLITINNTPNGKNINENCGSQNLENLKETVKKNNCDIGIAFDGDADRVIFIDEKGEEVDGDSIMAICAIDLKENNQLKNNCLVSTIMSNLGLKKTLKKYDINFVETNVGDKYVVEEMIKNNYNFGGEQSGHIIFFDYSTTGDGIISALQLLKIIIKKNKKLSEISKILEKYPQSLLNLEIKEKKKIEEIPFLKETLDEFNKEINGDGRIVIRYSGTQNVIRIMSENSTKEKNDFYTQEIAKIIQKEIGL